MTGRCTDCAQSVKGLRRATAWTFALRSQRSVSACLESVLLSATGEVRGDPPLCFELAASTDPTTRVPQLQADVA